MAIPTIASAVNVFSTRLDTLQHVLTVGASRFPESEAEYLSRRLAPDMHPLGTQVAFACNQPHNFSLWAEGATASDLDPHVVSMQQATSYIRDTQRRLEAIRADDSLLDSTKRLHLGPGLAAELTGHQYLNDFLMPNFYFHLVTAYAILRMAGVPLGKRDFMLHLVPHGKPSVD